MFFKWRAKRDIRRWIEINREYNLRSKKANNLRWLLRRMEFKSFIPGCLEDIVDWLEIEKRDHDDKVRAMAEEFARKQGREDGPEFTRTKAPQIQDDTPILLQDNLLLIKALIPMHVNSDSFPFLDRMLEHYDASISEQLESLCVEAQLALERIKLLVCRRRPKWGPAGDILMHFWEVLIENGIKHEICMRHRPGVDPIKEFGQDLKLEDLVLTREEVEKLKAEKDIDLTDLLD